MSFQLVAWVLGSEFQPLRVPSETGADASVSPLLAKMVLLGFAEHATDAGERAWPSTATLCRYTGTSRRSIFRAIRALEHAGILVLDRPGRGTLPPMYRIVIDRLPNDLIPRNTVDNPPARGDMVSPPIPSRGDMVSLRGDMVSLRGDMVSPKPISNQSVNRRTRTREPIAAAPAETPEQMRERVAASRRLPSDTAVTGLANVRRLLGRVEPT